VRAPVTSQSDEWETPQWLFDALHAEFGFTLDAAATKENAKCKRYCSLTEGINHAGYNGLSVSWNCERVYVNPPYSEIMDWVHKALYSTFVVMLLPVRTDNDWFRHLIESRNVTIRYFRKRIAFISNGVAMKSPPFASMVVIING